MYAAGLLIAAFAGVVCGVAVRALVGGVAAPVVFGAGVAVVVFAVLRAQWWTRARRDAVDYAIRASVQRGEPVSLESLARLAELRHLADAASREQARRGTEGAP